MPDTSLAAVADELAIRNLISELALVSDNGTSEEYAALFAEDGVWRMVETHPMAAEMPPRVGRAKIREGLEGSRAAGLGGPGSNARHIITNSRVRLNGDTAQARCYMTYLVGSNAAASVARFAVYEDRFVRTPEGWKLQMRTIEPG